MVIEKILTHLDEKDAAAEASGSRGAGRRPRRVCSTEPEYPVNTSCTTERRGIGGGRPEGWRQSEKSAGEQASLGLGSWSSGQSHVKGPDRQLLGDPDGRGMRV